MQIIPIPIEKEITMDDDLSKLILNSINDGDVLCLAQKIISKAEGQTVALASIEAGPEAIELNTIKILHLLN